MARYRHSWPWWRWALAGLSALGLALSAYLSWHYLTGESAIGCTGDSPCDQVLSSRWSAIGGVVPVSGLAAGAYLAMLVASLFVGPATAAADRRLAWGAMLVLAGAAAGSAVWFTIVQKWIIGEFCPYCLATHITSVLLAALVIWQARRNIGAVPTIGLPLVGLGLAGILAACQVAFPPRAVYRGGESKEKQPAATARAVPLVGSPDAQYVVSLYFDYKCPHCQQLHFLLDEAIRRYGGKLAFALCPAPLCRQCNPYVPQDVEEFKDSCELARVALTVWTAKREVFPDFNRWMFSLESGDYWRPRSLDAAKAKAIELVGRAKFDAAWADPWIEQYMQASIRAYGATIRDGSGAIPRLVYGSHWVVPGSDDADDFVPILHDSLGLPDVSNPETASPSGQ